MLKAEPNKAEEIKASVEGFRAISKKASQLELHYNNAAALAQEILSALNDASFKVENKQDIKLKNVLRENASKLRKVRDPLLTGGQERILEEFACRMNNAEGDAALQVMREAG